MIVVTGQVCLCYIPDQMTLPVYLGTSCCVLAILLPTGDSLFTSFCSPGILLPKWQLLTKHHNTIFTYYTYAITLTPCISSQGENLHDELDLRNVDNFDKPIIALLGSWAVGSADVV